MYAIFYSSRLISFNILPSTSVSSLLPVAPRSELALSYRAV